MIITKTLLVLATSALVVNAAPRRPVDPPGRPIDEILAIAGNMKHARANPNGIFNPSGKKSRDGKGEIVEYDIMVPIPQVVEARNPGRGNGNNGGNGRGGRNKRAITNYSSSYWPNNVIPYEISSQMNSDSISMIEQAVEEFNKYTCLRWVQRTTEADYVQFGDDGSGCWSYIGRIGGMQRINLNQPGCIWLKTVVHEMLHAAGVYHEQNRPDRDEHVTILVDNINPSMYHNFEKEANSNTEGVPYDYKSVMHYGGYAFSINGQLTIKTSVSSAQDIIGKAPTIGYNDIRLVTAAYQCSSSCPNAGCPAGSFQAHDCSCYCQAGSQNPPVVVCGTVCLEPESACQCSSISGACDGITHSTCDPASDSCMCDAGYVAYNGECIMPDSISCPEVGTDCGCSLKSGACDNLANTVCNSQTNACECTSGYALDQGACKLPNEFPCDAVEKQCYCSSKGSSACNSLANTFCDSATDSCKCVEDYYNNGGTCTVAPACTAVGTSCHCEVQGTDACSSLSNSVCDAQSGACECASSYINLNGVCQNAITNDGSSISPFTLNSEATVQWTVVSGTDSSAHGVPSNGKYLFASGTGSDWAQIESPDIDATGQWCVSYSVDLNNANIWVTNGVRWYGLYYGGNLGFFYSYTLWLPVATTQPFKIKLHANAYNPGPWSVKLDTVKIYEC